MSELKNRILKFQRGNLIPFNANFTTFQGPDLGTLRGSVLSSTPKDLPNLNATNDRFNRLGSRSLNNPTSGTSFSYGNLANAAIGVGSQLAQMGTKDNSTFTARRQAENADHIVNATGAALQAIPGFGTIAGAALIGVNTLGGMFMKNPSYLKDFNNYIPSESAGAFMSDYSKNQTLTGASNKGLGLAGKLTFNNNAKKYFDSALKNQKAITGIIDESNAAKEGMASADMFTSRNTMRGLGSNRWQSGTLFGRKGLKFQIEGFVTPNMDLLNRLKEERKTDKPIATPDLKKAKTLKETAPSKDRAEVLSAKQGAKLENPVSTENVIVEGKLHAHRHDLKDLEEYTDAKITEKGVPVVTTVQTDDKVEELAQGGDIQQIAEVEVGEIILHYELTKKLEELAKEGTPEAAIEAGKLLSGEIVTNTKDKTGILKETA